MSCRCRLARRTSSSRWLTRSGRTSPTAPSGSSPPWCTSGPTSTHKTSKSPERSAREMANTPWSADVVCVDVQVKVQLHRGTITVVALESANSLFDANLATFNKDASFNQVGRATQTDHSGHGCVCVCVCVCVRTPPPVSSSCGICRRRRLTTRPKTSTSSRCTTASRVDRDH